MPDPRASSSEPTETDRHLDTLERCIDNKLWTPTWMLRQWRDHIAAQQRKIEELEGQLDRLGN